MLCDTRKIKETPYHAQKEYSPHETRDEKLMNKNGYPGKLRIYRNQDRDLNLSKGSSPLCCFTIGEVFSHLENPNNLFLYLLYLLSLHPDI